MAELRAEIDRVDVALLDLFAERMGYIHRAPDLKVQADIPADVPERVREVIDNARRLAEERGLDGGLYAEIWRMIVAQAIATEEDIFRSKSEDSDGTD